ncbi:hypothetical protein TMEN_3855 [Trichophyton mentagrophytes]|uniref:DUF4536 domain-containing protein n=7 Tax=Trichophyton TaxID=5550 RepID=A0A9P5CXG8_9EURO|nr:uncharacterized protein TERG_00816 [Trichophyton rubrum CBS 118892]EGD97179.1 hypothetical protein TESG_04594 [Trichophyton tonsurans CBS 112818]EGE02025.1 hypothetical protein TEQG_01065 [Trichophyton equinum CBS 127.97]EZF10510.1 hypothetical protein H100_08270 [Trichophyton rubrum MR850]EZF37367.1 hypothetical protein H102_08227 [Trichophyton rubrum CBS 100081]EZF47896.1 hypothetical protein H103_08252 [Trichophyton rubrum CBS 288.86]EZF58671.1 hypothetical protein H104_08203 [Trichophy
MARQSDAPWEINPKDIEKTIAQDKYDDCLACRATGSLALAGLGGWSYYTGMKNLREQEQKILASGSKYRMGSRRLGVIMISTSLVGLGIWRAFN